MWNVTDAVELVPLDEDSNYHDPVGFLPRLRESRPVALVRMPGYGRAWIITRYADVRTILADPQLAKDVHRSAAPASPGRARRRASTRTCSTPTRLTAPGCAAWYRRCSRRAAPRGAATAAEEIAAGLLDEMAAARGDVIDLLDAYARSLPIAVLCELFGIPVAERAWITVTVSAYDERAEHRARGAGAGRLLHGADRQRAPFHSTVFLLVMAGFDTTVNLIASSTLALLTQWPGNPMRHNDRDAPSAVSIG